MDRIKLITLISGTAIVVDGYWLLAVSDDLPFDTVIARAESGMLTVVVGGIMLLIGILRRS